MAKWGRWQLPTVMRSYPHLLALDAFIWSAYLRQAGDSILKVQYDVWVGTPVQWRPGVEPVKNQAECTSCKRIDAIFLGRDHTIHLVEIKPFGNYVAYGQVKMYRSLLLAERPALGKIKMDIVCNKADEDILAISKVEGIHIEQMEIHSEV